MATQNIGPREQGGGGLGTVSRGWGGAFVTNTTASSATEGGKLVLAADDGAVMATGHRLGVIEFKGAEDASNNLAIGARIEALAADTFSTTANETSLKFYTTTGDADEKLALTIDNTQTASFAGTIVTNKQSVTNMADNG